MKFAATAVTVSLMALAAAETRASVRIQLAVLTVAGVALIPMMQFRPQLFTFMLLSALMVLLARDSFRPSGASIWLALPIFALWANTHGGVAAGLAVLALYAGVRGLEDLVRRTRLADVDSAGWRYARLRGRDAGQSIRLRQLARGCTGDTESDDARDH